jgi:archaellum biogenesis protein FlaJ (TadC family)
MIPASVWIGLSAVSALMFVGSLFVLRFLLIRMPADYFVRERQAGGDWLGQHPAMRVLATLIKNVVGVVLLVLGVIMLFTPGQGVLLILVGVSLLDVPGKRAIELRIVSNPTVLRTINHLRAKAGRPPIVVDEERAQRATSAQRASRR